MLNMSRDIKEGTMHCESIKDKDAAIESDEKNN